MNPISLTSIQQSIESLAERISAPVDLLPTYGRSIDGAHPHIEVDARGMHFVVIERGCELERKTTRDLDELLCWVFDSVTFSMACSFELKNRISGQDSRRLMWQHQLELLRRLNESWSCKRENEIQKILLKNRFND